MRGLLAKRQESCNRLAAIIVPFYPWAFEEGTFITFPEEGDPFKVVLRRPKADVFEGVRAAYQAFLAQFLFAATLLLNISPDEIQAELRDVKIWRCARGWLGEIEFKWLCGRLMLTHTESEAIELLEKIYSGSVSRLENKVVKTGIPKRPWRSIVKALLAETREQFALLHRACWSALLKIEKANQGRSRPDPLPAAMADWLGAFVRPEGPRSKAAQAAVHKPPSRAVVRANKTQRLNQKLNTRRLRQAIRPGASLSILLESMAIQALREAVFLGGLPSKSGHNIKVAYTHVADRMNLKTFEGEVARVKKQMAPVPSSWEKTKLAKSLALLHGGLCPLEVSPRMSLPNAVWHDVALIIEKLDPAAAIGRDRADPRAVVEALVTMVQQGLSPEELPPGSPSRATIFRTRARWLRQGVLARVQAALEEAFGQFPSLFPQRAAHSGQPKNAKPGTRTKSHKNTG